MYQLQQPSKYDSCIEALKGFVESFPESFSGVEALNEVFLSCLKGVVNEKSSDQGYINICSIFDVLIDLAPLIKKEHKEKILETFDQFLLYIVHCEHFVKWFKSFLQVICILIKKFESDGNLGQTILKYIQKYHQEEFFDEVSFFDFLNVSFNFSPRIYEEKDFDFLIHYVQTQLELKII